MKRKHQHLLGTVPCGNFAKQQDDVPKHRLSKSEQSQWDQIKHCFARLIPHGAESLSAQSIRGALWSSYDITPVAKIEADPDTAPLFNRRSRHFALQYLAGKTSAENRKAVLRYVRRLSPEDRAEYQYEYKAWCKWTRAGEKHKQKEQ